MSGQYHSHVRSIKQWIVWSIFLFTAMYAVEVRGASDDQGAMDASDIIELSIEQLMQVEVTSVAGVSQSLLKTPAAVYVISREDIRRTGHQSIADALRMVPGVQVAQSNSHTWAVSARGFNSHLANKLLVQVDGRSVYTPLFSGVYWDTQDLVLDDLDRIEIVRGPGASLWGANAVNGVINITTRSAEETQGLYITGGGGSYEQGFGAMRYGGQFGDDVFYRVWGKYKNRDSLVDSAGDTPDNWDMGNGGFRLDGHGSDDVQWMLEGGVYGSDHIGQRTATTNLIAPTGSAIAVKDRRVRGAHLLGRITANQSKDTGWSLQSYVDYTYRTGIVFRESRYTFDVDFRKYGQITDNQHLIWGLRVNHSHDDTNYDPTISFNRNERPTTTISGFLQDTIELVPDRLSLMLGSKFEHNSFSGFEYQPGARLAWTPDDQRTFWASVSRAVRTPARVDQDFNLAIGTFFPPTLGVTTPTFFKLLGSEDVKSEDLLAWELGARMNVTDHVTLDVAGYFNQYDDLVTFQFSPTALALVATNDASGESCGVEVAAKWEAADNLCLAAGYSWQRLFIHSGSVADEGTLPRNQFHLRSYLDICKNLEFNAAIYYVDSLPAIGVDSYIRVDAGLTWRPRDNVEIAVWGQNLFDPEHPEFDGSSISQTWEVRRSVYAQVTVRF